MPFGLIHFSLNFMHLVFSLNVPELMVSTCRCRVPAMILAVPIDVNRTKMLTRFGPAQAGHRSFRWCCCHQHHQHPTITATGIGSLRHASDTDVASAEVSPVVKSTN